VIGPRLGRRDGTFRPGGRWFTQHERWYLCRCDGFEVAPGVEAAVRAEGIRELRWWSVDELRAQAVVTAPRGLADVLERVLAGDLPDPDGDLGR
jgi:hypothetical protein